MLSKKQMKRACALNDQLYIYHTAPIDSRKHDEYIRLVDQASKRQFQEITLGDDADEAFRLMEAADRGVWLPRGRVKVLTEAQRAHVPEFCTVRTPGWRVRFQKHVESLRVAHTPMVH